MKQKIVCCQTNSCHLVAALLCFAPTKKKLEQMILTAWFCFTSKVKYRHEKGLHQETLDIVT